MRIVIDFQGAQGASRGRGIGRYSSNFTDALLHAKHDHEVLVVINAALSESVPEILDHFVQSFPSATLKIWEPMSGNSKLDKELSKELRIQFIDSLAPDLVLVTSLFEGHSDKISVSIPAGKPYKHAVILYDLIPLVRHETYLSDQGVRGWYHEQVGELLKADLLLSISEASKREALEMLQIDEAKIVNISSAADSIFKPVIVPYLEEQEIRTTHNISRSFILYTGGIDFRKNIEGLLEAFSMLEANLRNRYHLVIVCRVDQSSLVALKAIQEKLGLEPDDVVFTGFVSDDDLVNLYNMADLFVFPSWHEGFGLPVLEAMQSGTATIVSNVSSLPEIVKHPDALFDPMDKADISRAMSSVLESPNFRQELEQHGLLQASNFSWEITADIALAAIEKVGFTKTVGDDFKDQRVRKSVPLELERLAFFSPMFPEKSGISEYSRLLLTELTEYYSITVFSNLEGDARRFTENRIPIEHISKFEATASTFSRIVYQMGNSDFHLNFEDLNERFPGVVVLHDFFLSGLHFFESQILASGESWVSKLHQNHGYEALHSLSKATNESDLISAYPTNLKILQQAKGVIVHSVTAVELASDWYGDLDPKHFSVVPLVRQNQSSQIQFLEEPPTTKLISSFGFLAESKYSKEIIVALSKCQRFLDGDYKFVFVGEAAPDFRAQISKLIHKHGLEGKVGISGWLSEDDYKKHLAGTTLAVQLRRGAKGENSAAVLDALGSGVVTICSNSGTMKDLPDDIVVKIQDPLAVEELVKVLDRLLSKTDECEFQEMRIAAQRYVRDLHSPVSCARQYFDAIELAYCQPRVAIDKFAEIAIRENLDAGQINDLARSLAVTYPPSPRRPKLFLDIGISGNWEGKRAEDLFARCVKHLETNKMWDLQPVFFDEASGVFHYEQKWLVNRFGLNFEMRHDSIVEAFLGDVYCDISGEFKPERRLLLQRRGVMVFDSWEFEKLASGRLG